MRELSLFTGAGGGIWGSKLLGWRTVGYVEKNKRNQDVISARIRDGYFCNAPIFGDIRDFIREGYAGSYTGLVDVLTAGFPCQRFSSAARGRNVAENLWPETIETIRIVKPRALLLENVSGAWKQMERCCHELFEIGYRTSTRFLSAADLGAPHIRSRWWVRGYSYSHGESVSAEHGKVARMPKASSPIWTEAEPEDLRVADGLASWGHELEALGNGQVPAMVVEAWEAF